MNPAIAVRYWTVLLVLLVVAGCASSMGGGGGVDTPSPADTGTERETASDSEDEPLTNTLKWSTASEVDNFGFDIYRGTSEEGPFERITVTPIAGAGTVDEPRHYQFVDDAIDPGKDYYYYVESISIGGVREKFSPIIKAPAKRPN